MTSHKKSVSIKHLHVALPLVHEVLGDRDLGRKGRDSGSLVVRAHSSRVHSAAWVILGEGV